MAQQVCIQCFQYLGSAERSVQGVRRGKEGPLHIGCATPAEIRIAQRSGYPHMRQDQTPAMVPAS